MEKILDIREEDGNIELLTSWVGFAGEETWEPLNRLHADVPDLVRDFCAESTKPAAQQALTTLNNKSSNSRKRSPATNSRQPTKRRRSRR